LEWIADVACCVVSAGGGGGHDTVGGGLKDRARCDVGDGEV
jgi:hypothetical protein